MQECMPTTAHCSIVVVFIIQVFSYFFKCCVLILLVCACPVYHCVICVYAIRSSDHNFPINTYLLTCLQLNAAARAAFVGNWFLTLNLTLSKILYAHFLIQYIKLFFAEIMLAVYAWSKLLLFFIIILYPTLAEMLLKTCYLTL